MKKKKKRINELTPKVKCGFVTDIVDSKPTYKSSGSKIFKPLLILHY